MRDGLREVSCGYDNKPEEIEPGRGRQTNIIGICWKGKQRRLTLGVWPVVDLSVARKKAREALRLASEGQDPIAMRREEVSQRIANSMESVARHFCKRGILQNATRNYSTRRF